MMPRRGRAAAEIRPRCDGDAVGRWGGDAVEMGSRWGRDAVEMRWRWPQLLLGRGSAGGRPGRGGGGSGGRGGEGGGGIGGGHAEEGEEGAAAWVVRGWGWVWGLG